MIAIEDDALHSALGTGSFVGVFQRAGRRLGTEHVVIAMVDTAVLIAAEGSEPAEHVFPREENRDGDAMVSGIFCVPAVDGHGVTGLFVVVGENRRELLECDVGGEFFPTIIEPRLGIESVVIAGSDGIIPVPGT